MQSPHHPDLELKVLLVGVFLMASLLGFILYFVSMGNNTQSEIRRPESGNSQLHDGEAEPAINDTPSEDGSYPEVIPEAIVELGGQRIDLEKYDFSQVPVIEHQMPSEKILGPASTTLDERARQMYCDMLHGFRNVKWMFILQDADLNEATSVLEAIQLDYFADMPWIVTSDVYTFVDESDSAKYVTDDELYEAIEIYEDDSAESVAPDTLVNPEGEIGFELGGSGHLLVVLNPIPSYDEIASSDARLDEVYSDYASGLWEGASEYDKALHAYEYLIGICDYSIEGETDEERNADLEGKQTAESALVNHASVCGGYANALTYLLHRAGVTCWTVCGRVTSATEDANFLSVVPLDENGLPNDGHAWNIACLDGTWCYIDCTFGDSNGLVLDSSPTVDRGLCDYSYFGMTSTQLADNAYVLDSPEQYPACDSPQCNWFLRNGMRFDTFDASAFGDLMNETVAQEGRDFPLSVQYATESEYAIANEQVPGIVGNYPYSEGVLSVTTNETMRTITVNMTPYGSF